MSSDLSANDTSRQPQATQQATDATARATANALAHLTPLVIRAEAGDAAARAAIPAACGAASAALGALRDELNALTTRGYAGVADMRARVAQTRPLAERLDAAHAEAIRRQDWQRARRLQRALARWRQDATALRAELAGVTASIAQLNAALAEATPIMSDLAARCQRLVPPTAAPAAAPTAAPTADATPHTATPAPEEAAHHG